MKKLLADPPYCPGMYAMDFYCKYENDGHEYGEFPHQPYDVHTKAQAVAKARSWGWIYHKDGAATCPKCR